MNTNLILDYIAQRMRELGVEKYSWEPITISVPNNGSNKLLNDGSYYYPCWVFRNVFPVVLGATITIDSEEQASQIGNFETWTSLSGIEHKGEVTISAAGFGAAITVEFIRVFIE